MSPSVGGADVGARLRGRWPLRGSPEACEFLLEAYGSPTRHYHDLVHLTEVLDRLEELAEHGAAYDPVTTVLAAWFHDAVYDGLPGAEERSARLAADALTGAVSTGELTAGQVDEVGRLVRLTERHRPASGDLDGAALCDADLAILAAPPDRYRAYTQAVRREYADVPDDAFASGRAEVLRALAAAPTLFTTPQAQARWEAAARANLSAELARLTAAPDRP